VSNFRTGTDTEAERKAMAARAPVYKYYFQWYSPVREGKLRSYHTLDIPFVFQNVDIAESMVGKGPERYALADKMSAAYSAFARTGNPNTKSLPKWAPFTTGQRATMIFNTNRVSTIRTAKSGWRGWPKKRRRRRRKRARWKAPLKSTSPNWWIAAGWARFSGAFSPCAACA
jgi:para-nitrobenzyl esterase